MQVFHNVFRKNKGDNLLETKMSKNETNADQKEQVLDSLKDNYVRRIEEVDAFSKRLSNACADVNTEFLYGSLNLIQHYLDFQKKHTNQFSGWYSTDLITNLVKQNTKAWVQAVENTDTLYIQGMKNMKNNLRALNKNSILYLQSTERACDICENLQPHQKNGAGLETKQKQKKLAEPTPKLSQT